MTQQNLLFTTLSVDSLKAIIADVFKENISAYKAESAPLVPESERILEAPEVLELLKISPATLENWKRQNRIPFYRIGRRVYFKESEIIKTLTKGKLEDKSRRGKK